MEEQVTSLPAGPGMRRRWLYAVPMMVVSAFAQWLGQLVLLVWWSSPLDDILADIGKPKPAPTFWQEFGEVLHDGWYGARVPAVVLAWFLLTRGRIAPWPAACVVVSVLAMLPVIITLTGDFADALPNIAFALALLWLSWELGRQAVKVLTRPIARDLVSSKLEIPYRLRGNKQDLKRRTIMLGQAKEARLVEVESKESWRPNKGDTSPPPRNLMCWFRPSEMMRSVRFVAKCRHGPPEVAGPALLAAINQRRRNCGPAHLSGNVMCWFHPSERCEAFVWWLSAVTVPPRFLLAAGPVPHLPWRQ